MHFGNILHASISDTTPVISIVDIGARTENGIFCTSIRDDPHVRTIED